MFFIFFAQSALEAPEGSPEQSQSSLPNKTYFIWHLGSKVTNRKQNENEKNKTNTIVKRSPFCLYVRVEVCQPGWKYQWSGENEQAPALSAAHETIAFTVGHTTFCGDQLRSETNVQIKQG